MKVSSRDIIIVGEMSQADKTYILKRKTIKNRIREEKNPLLLCS